MKTNLIISLFLLFAVTSCEDELVINVPPAVQQQSPPPPTASSTVNLEKLTLTAAAGMDLNLTLPVNSAVLKGSSNYAQTYNWKKLSGPAVYSIDDPQSKLINLTNLEKGVYEFELTAAARGQKAMDTVRIFVYDRVGSNELIFKDQQWLCSGGCHLLIKDFHALLPKGFSFKVYVQRDKDTRWVEVADGYPGAGDYAWRIYDAGLAIYLSDHADVPTYTDVKIIF